MRSLPFFALAPRGGGVVPVMPLVVLLAVTRVLARLVRLRLCDAALRAGRRRSLTGERERTDQQHHSNRGRELFHHCVPPLIVSAGAMPRILPMISRRDALAG